MEVFESAPLRLASGGERLTTGFRPVRGRTSVHLYLHGGTAGEWMWHFPETIVAGYDYATEQAELGHASVVIDTLGYGTSDHPLGTAECVGSLADIAGRRPRSPVVVGGRAELRQNLAAIGARLNDGSARRRTSEAEAARGIEPRYGDLQD